MNAIVTTTLTAKITLELNEEEAYALNKMSGYGASTVIERVHAFAHGFEEGSKGRRGLKSLMETVVKLHAPLAEIERIRKEGKEIKVV